MAEGARTNLVLDHLAKVCSVGVRHTYNISSSAKKKTLRIGVAFTHR